MVGYVHMQLHTSTPCGQVPMSKSEKCRQPESQDLGGREGSSHNFAPTAKWLQYSYRGLDIWFSRPHPLPSLNMCL